MTEIDSNEPAGTAAFLRVLRGRWRVIALTLAVCVAVSAVVVTHLSKTYSATAEILVTPISSSDEAFVGIPVLTDSAIAPTTSVLTISRIVKSPATEAIAHRLYGGGPHSGVALARHVSVSPLAQTSIVAVTGSGPTPGEASKLANAFARATILRRTADFQRVLKPTVARLRAQAAKLHGHAVSAQRAAIQSRLAVLAPLVDENDPSVQMFQTATPPTGPSSPRPAVVIGAAIVAGLVLGALLAFLYDAVDPRVRRLDQVASALGLHPGRAVARLRAGERAPVTLWALAPRLLAARAGKANRMRTIAVVGATGGARVALAVARTVGSPDRPAVLLDRRGELDETVVDREPNVVLAAEAKPDRPGKSGETLVVDCPSLDEDVSGLATVRSADAVVAVARLNRTSKADLRELAELLHDSGAPIVAAVAVALPRPRTRLAHGLTGLLRNTGAFLMTAFAVVPATARDRVMSLSEQRQGTPAPSEDAAPEPPAREQRPGPATTLLAADVSRTPRRYRRPE